MKLYDGIGKNIAHVDRLPLGDHIGMFLHHQPAHVGEEETPVGVVRVRVCFRELVVDPMVPDPLEHWILKLEVGECACAGTVATPTDQSAWFGRCGLVGGCG